MTRSNSLNQLNEKLAPLPLEQRIALIAAQSERAVFTTSLGIEDQVLTWAIASFGRSIEMTTLQTGRLFAETLSLLEETRQRFGAEIKEFFPEKQQVEEYVQRYGKDGFYQSIEARKACCTIRKVAPLAAALNGADAWITGMRRQSSNARSRVELVEWDDQRKLLKFNPIADWSVEQVKQAVSDHDIPVNPLHHKGYPSIGCQPCTRAVKPGEDERAGRWWWESDGNQECGLHEHRLGNQSHLTGNSGEHNEGSDRAPDRV